MSQPDRERPATLSIKQHPELRHVFAHLIMAVEYLQEALAGAMEPKVDWTQVRAKARAAHYTLEEIRGLVFFGESFEDWVGTAWRQPQHHEGGDPSGETEAQEALPQVSEGLVKDADLAPRLPSEGVPDPVRHNQAHVYWGKSRGGTRERR